MDSMDISRGQSSTSHGRRSRQLSPPSSSTRLKQTHSPLVEEEEASTIYFYVCHQTGPISCSLFAMDVPKAVSWLQPCNTGARDFIYPSLEFLANDFPTDMFCVKLGSKLYLFGGSSPPGPNDYHYEFYSDLYIIDTALLSSNTSTTVCDKASPVLTKGPSMNTGKPFGHAFVAGGKIYVIAPCFNDMWDNLVEFEMFDPDTNEWSALPDPLFNEMVVHAVVINNKVVLGTEDRDFYCYDVNSGTWDDVGALMPTIPDPAFEGHPAVCGKFLYSFHGFSIAQFGPTTEQDIETKANTLFPWTSYVASPVIDAIYDAGHVVEKSSCLVHLGNKLFCCAVSGGYVKQGDNVDRTCPEETVINLVIFRVPDETAYEPVVDKDLDVVFGAQLVRTAQLFLKSHNGAGLRNAGLLGCFSNAKKLT